MQVLVYEFTPQQPGVYNVKLDIETVYNYSFQSNFKITVTEPTGGGELPESAINVPSLITCKEGQTKELFLAPITQDIISVYKLSGPGQVIRTQNGYVWNFTPDYNYVPYYMTSKEETLVIVSNESGRGNFIHSAVVRTENVTRQPTPNTLSIVVGENQRFVIPLERLYNNPDNIPLASFIFLDSSDNSNTAGLLNEQLLNEIILNSLGSGTATNQFAYSEYISVLGNSIVGSFPLGFVPRNTFYTDLRIEWSAVFLNGAIITGQLNITVVKRKVLIQGKQVSYTFASDTVNYIKASDLFEYPVQGVVYYTAISSNAQLHEFNGEVYLKAYMPASKFKFPTTTITETYVIMARTLDEQIAYSTVHVTYVHSFKPIRFKSSPRFLVYNYKKARLKLNNYLKNEDNLPIVRAQVIQQGFKRLEGQEYYRDDRDKLLEIASAHNVRSATFNLDNRWGDGLKIRL